MLRIITTLLLLLAAPYAASAGPGHDHGHDHGEAATGQSVATPRLEAAGSDIELVAVAEGHTLTLYLDRLDTNAPIDNATIEVSGEGLATVDAKRIAAGTYALEADWVDRPGAHALVFTVVTPDAADLLNGQLVIPDAAVAASPVALPVSKILKSPVLWALMAGALVFGFLIATARRSRVALSSEQGDAPTALSDRVSTQAFRSAAEVIFIALVLSAAAVPTALAGPGHDHGDGGHGDQTPSATGGNVPAKLPDGSVFVPKPTQRLLQVRTHVVAEEQASQTRKLMGTIVPDPSAFGRLQAPMDGQIEVGERGVSFVGQKVEAGEILALLSPTIPLADLGTMQQLRAEVDGKLRIAEQKLARLTRIANVVAQRDIDDTKADRDALLEQKRVLQPKGVEKFALKAPVSGIISVANVRAGQVVTARDTLFEIVDPARVWVEAVGTDSHTDGSVVSAHAVDAEGHALKLAFVGQSPTLRQQQRPLLFRLDEVHSGLAIGATVTVLAQMPQTLKGVVLPDSAVVRGFNGLSQVWVKASAERFRSMTVTSIPLDGARVLVTAGVQPGERVVIGGAELINQIR